MTGEIAFIFALLGVAAVLFASGWIRLDITALLVVLALMVSGVITVGEAASGFGDPLVLLIACLFIVGEALVQTGIAYRVGDWLLKAGGKSETRLLVVMMGMAALLGCFMSSTAVVAIFIPIVLRVAARTRTAPSRLLMSLSYAALISGMLTLIATTPNLVVNGALADAGAEPFGLFSFTLVGLGVLVVCVAYMALIGRRLVPVREMESKSIRLRGSMRELLVRYGLEDQLHRIRIKRGSPLLGRTVEGAKLRTKWELHLLAIDRTVRGRPTLAPVHPETELRAGDVLVAKAPEEEVAALVEEQNLTRLDIPPGERRRLRYAIGIAEVLVPPESARVGQSLRDMGFRSHFDLMVLGLRRKGETIKGDHAAEPLEAGDTLLVAGPWKKIQQLEPDPLDLLLLSLPAEIDEVAPARRRAPVAATVIGLMIVLLVLGWIPMTATVLAAALVLILSRCLTMERAYGSIQWPSLVLVAGLLPIAKALDSTGGLELIAGGLASAVGGMGPRALMTVVFALTAGMGLFMSNTASALLVAPLAIRLAEDAGLAPHPFALTVIIAASAAYVTPVSSPVVTLVVAPGEYRFLDFVKAGTPLLFLTWIVTILLVPLLFPW